MRVNQTSYTIASFCNLMVENKIVVNRHYQRSAKVWPPAARSYLIDTILLGYPIHKLSLFQRTDLKTRRTVHEIVDGQQRSQAILDFFTNKLRITGKSDFAGMTYSQLDEEHQGAFLGYSIGADEFVGATEEQIRQVFRRMNSYTVPLNAQEQRHAVFQGAFKWFMVEVSERYAQSMKSMGVFSERDLIRMADVTLIAEVVMSLYAGILSASNSKIDQFYRDHEQSFDDAAVISARLDNAFSWIFDMEPIHNTGLMKSYNFFALILAVIHYQNPVSALNEIYPLEHPTDIRGAYILSNLSNLAAALDEPGLHTQYEAFIKASAGATTRLAQRRIRFVYFCRALGPDTLT